MNQPHPLLLKFLDDRDQFGDRELAALVKELKVQPDLAQALHGQLLVDDLLGQKMAVDRRDFAAQVRQRIYDQEGGLAGAVHSERELSEHVDHMRRLAVQETAGMRRTRRWRRLRHAATSALIAMLAIAAGWWYATGRSIQVVARITASQGDSTLVRSGSNQSLTMGDELLSDDAVQLAAAATAQIRYTDGTTIDLVGPADVHLPPGPQRWQKWLTMPEGKQLDLQRGVLRADVAAQPKDEPLVIDTPLARARVVGTRLQLDAQTSSTRLDVYQGRVELAMQGNDPKSVLVQADQFAVATAEGLQLETTPWPYRRNAAVLLVGGGNAKALLRTAAGPADGSAPRFSEIELAPLGAAVLEPSGAMDLADGSFSGEAANEALLTACQESNAFSLLTVFRTDNVRQGGPARLVTFATDHHNYNFTLGQDGSTLLWRIFVNGDGGLGEQRQVQLATIQPQREYHLVVTYRPGELAAYLDGQRVFHSDQVIGDLSCWLPRHLSFGDETNGERRWAGRLEAVAILNEALNEEDVRRDWQLWKNRAELNKSDATEEPGH